VREGDESLPGGSRQQAAVGGDIQAPVVEFVWQTMIETGRFADPVSPVTVIEADAPRLTVATENTPVPVLPGIST